MPSTPPWLEPLRNHPDLAATGFRLLPAEAIERALAKRRRRAAPVRIGTSSELLANMRGIGLILHSDDPGRLYARFADEAGALRSGRGGADELDGR